MRRNKKRHFFILTKGKALRLDGISTTKKRRPDVIKATFYRSAAPQAPCGSAQSDTVLTDLFGFFLGMDQLNGTLRAEFVIAFERLVNPGIVL